MKIRLTSILLFFPFFMVLIAFPSVGLTAEDGHDLTSSLWAKAVLEVPGAPVALIWKMVGADITPSGDQVISGYFYADPADFAYGSVYNPELFVKIYIAANGWCNMAFNHVTVDPVTVYSAHGVAGTSQQSGTATLTNRLVEHPYNGVSIDTALQSSGGSPTASSDTGYTVASDLWTKAVLRPLTGPVNLIWKEIGSDTTHSGDTVVSGYFYASPDDFAYGSVFNPEVFVKVYIAANGWCNMAFNHVAVDDVDVYTANQYSGTPHQTSAITLTGRLSEHEYTLSESERPQPNSESITIASKAVGTIYSISVGLPPGYVESGPPYAAIFLLDGDSFFTNFYNSYDEDDDFILIGINNSHRRNIDYLPNNTCEEERGGNSAFLDFLVSELVPYLDDNYNINPAQRLLFGFSHGGSFVFYTLFTDHGQYFPFLFSIDASLQCWNVSLLERSYYSANDRLPVIFYSSGASKGNADAIEPIMKDLIKRNYAGFIVQFNEVRGTHEGTLNTAISNGFAWFGSQIQDASE